MAQNDFDEAFYEESYNLNIIYRKLMTATSVLTVSFVLLSLVCLLSSWELRGVFRIRVLASSLIAMGLSSAIGNFIFLLDWHGLIKLDCVSVEVILRFWEVQGFIDAVNLILLAANLLAMELRYNLGRHFPER